MCLYKSVFVVNFILVMVGLRGSARRLKQQGDSFGIETGDIDCRSCTFAVGLRDASAGAGCTLMRLVIFSWR